MDEILLEVLFAILEFLFETVLETLVESALEYGSRSLLKDFSDVFRGAEEEHPTLAFLTYTLIGALFGGLSLLVFPHPLLRSTHFHGISLLLSPLATGYAMTVIARKVDESGKLRMHFAKFQNGFAFALGMALIRFLFTR